MMAPEGAFNFGVVDHRFLARSLGLLNPPPPIVIGLETTIYQAIELLQSHKLGGLLITDEKGKVCGMFTERDVVTKVSLSDLPLQTTLIGEVMTPNPETASMTTTVAFALNMMSQGGYRHIPIVDDDGFPVGIISVKNIVDYICGALTKDLFRFGNE